MNRSPAFELEIANVDRSCDATVTSQIYNAVRSAILAGRLRPGTKLPSSRDLAISLGVSRKPVLQAYERLAAERHLRGVRGAGTYVAAGPHLTRHTTSSLSLSEWVRHPLAPRKTQRPFACSAAAADVMTREQWAGLMRRSGCRPRTSGLTNDLKAAIANGENLAGVQCDPRDVVIIPAADQSILLLARAFGEPADACLLDCAFDVERAVLMAAAGFRTEQASIDEEGLVVDADKEARVAYLRPSAEGLEGVSLSPVRRYMLLAWARRHHAAIIEDDFDDVVDPRPAAAAPLKALDSRGSVASVAAIWRSLLPPIGIGFAIMPGGVAGSIDPLFSVFGGTPRDEHEAALLAVIESGRLARHLVRMRSVYRERREVMLSELDRMLEGAITGIKRGPALQLIVQLARGYDDEAIAALAAADGLEVQALSIFDGQRIPALRLGYGGTPPAAIPDAVSRLASVFERASPAGESSAEMNL